MSVWALAALSATYWVLKFAGANSPSVSVASVAGPAPASDPVNIAKVFGPPVAVASAPLPNTPPAIDPSARFSLLGVVADRGNAGVALISVEGKAARPYRVGSQITDTYLLKSVSTRSATLAPLAADGAGFTLELPRTASGAPLPVPASSPAAQPAQIPQPNQTPRPPRTRASAV